MNRLRAWCSRFAGLFGKERKDRELAEELESHLQMHIADNLRAGMHAAEARRHALIRLGGVEQTKERYRERRGFPWLESVLQDLKFGVRMLRKNPGFTVVAVLTLALGIGANTAIFTFVRSILLRPLPYPQPNQLMWISDFVPRVKSSLFSPAPDYQAWQSRSHSFDGMAAFNSNDYNLTGVQRAVRVQVVNVTPSFFSLLGMQPTLGRSFSINEAQPGGPNVAVLAYGFWQSQFGADKDVIGKTIALNGTPHNVIGVMPAAFRFPDSEVDPDLIIPLVLHPYNPADPGMLAVSVIGRLKGGFRPTQAIEELDGISKQVHSEDSAGAKNFLAGMRAEIVPLQRHLTGDVSTPLIILLSAAGLVLLIACVNVANMQLARAAARQKEVAMRAALGADRFRLLRQFTAENIPLSLCGGAAGVALGIIAVELARSLPIPHVSPVATIQIDGAVLFFSLALTLVTTILFGIAPVGVLSQHDVAAVTNTTGIRATAGARERRVRSVLVISELALAVMLLSGAGLLIRTLLGLLMTDPGFQPRGLLTATINVSGTKYADRDKQQAFFHEVFERVQGMPGAQTSAMAYWFPMTNHLHRSSGVRVEGGPIPPPGLAPLVDVNAVNSTYFKTLGTPVLGGRVFEEQDNSSSVPVVILNESAVRMFFPAENPIGKRMKAVTAEKWSEVVGVVGDAKDFSLDHVASPVMYVPITQSPSLDSVEVAIRTDGDPAALAPIFRREIAAIDDDSPISDISSMETRLANSIAPRRLNAIGLSVFAGLALVLAAVGVYGVVSYSVEQCTREIGVRLALGAERATILRMVIAQAFGLALIGTSIGLAGALGLTRFLSSFLFGVNPLDPVTFATVSVVVLVVALPACYIPARRATKVDPMTALRYE